MTDIFVTIQDLRQAKLCFSGARGFFKHHNLDWSEFVKNGLPLEDIQQLNDALANKVVAATIERVEAENGR